MSKSETKSAGRPPALKFHPDTLANLRDELKTDSPQVILDHIVKFYQMWGDAENTGVLRAVMEEANKDVSSEEIIKRIQSPFEDPQDYKDEPIVEIKGSLSDTETIGSKNDLKGLFEPSIISEEDVKAWQEEIEDLRAQNAKLLELLEEERQQPHSIPGSFQRESIYGEEFLHRTPDFEGTNIPVTTHLPSYQEFDAAIIGAATLEVMDQVIEAIQDSAGLNGNQQTGLLMRAKGKRKLLEGLK